MRYLLDCLLTRLRWMFQRSRVIKCKDGSIIRMD